MNKDGLLEINGSVVSVSNFFEFLHGDMENMISHDALSANQVIADGCNT